MTYKDPIEPFLAFYIYNLYSSPLPGSKLYLRKSLVRGFCEEIGHDFEVLLGPGIEEVNVEGDSGLLTVT